MSRLQSHYVEIAESHDYTPTGSNLDGVLASSLTRRFVAVDGRETVAAALDRPTIVTTGVGMTGPPHLGTVGQILTAIRLQELGLDVQFVLADLEPYHRGVDYREVRRLAERYRVFVRDLGFDSEQGVLRTMDEDRDVMHTAHLLARHYAPEARDYWPETEPSDWERAVESMYRSVSEFDGPTSEAASVHSTVLHFADFLHPLLKEDYEQVVVALGIDEHELAVATRRFARDAGVPGAIAGLHARMITGVADYPKMAKSVPESGISLDMPSEDIRSLVLADDADDPAESLVCQAVRLASRYDSQRLAEVTDACIAGGERWTAVKRKYADYVCELAARWRATSGVAVEPSFG